MTSKKKLGSKLANGVRQVKLQHGQPAVAPAKSVATVKATAKPAPAVAVNQPTQPPARKAITKQEIISQAEVNRLHPQRIWPD